MTDDFDDDAEPHTWVNENDYLSLLPSDSQRFSDASEAQTQDRLKLLYSVGLDICELTTLDDILPSIRYAIRSSWQQSVSLLRRPTRTTN